LLPIFRGMLVLALVGFASPVRADEAPILSAADLQAMHAALSEAQSGDWSRAYAEVATTSDPLLTKMLRWMDYSRPGTPGRFVDIAEFVEQNPDWPAQKALRGHAEEALAGESDAIAAEWFKRYPALSATGKVREAEIMLNAGNLEGGNAALRATWIGADFGPLDEKNFLAHHSASIRPEDQIKRVDRLLWDGQSDAAHRILPLLPADYRAVSQARLALAAQARNAETLVMRVPQQLRSDPGLLFEEVRYLRKKEMTAAAVQLLLSQHTDLVRPAAWLNERQAVARQVLASGNAALAYQLVEQHGLIEGNAFSEAEFLLGYIALRYKKQPALAFEHFSQILTRVNTPFAKSRAGYWGGRAAEAQGKAELAAKWYAAGADHMATFYGQLAAHQLGRDAPPRPVPEPVPTADQLTQFDSNEVVRAARIFFELGDAAHGKACLLHLARKAASPTMFAMLANLAEKEGRIDLAIAVAKRAIEAGTPLMIHGYPTTELPNGGTAENPLLFAIMRQESAFERDAVSPVGARGLMQLMPATASAIAAKMQLPFSADRLTADGTYNALLGRTYVETLIDDFGGSYALAIAAYNAGPGRVRQWLHDYGDPRGGSIDMIDWIEMIPINETRNYVQRVLENLQIYRGQTGRESAFCLAADLAR
jgi:soluble lytic murein transglycosylase